MFGNLRLVATDKLSEYRANTDLFLQLGNEDFAAAIRAGIRPPATNPYRAPWLLYHAWRQPRIQVDEHTAGLIRDLMTGRAAGDGTRAHRGRRSGSWAGATTTCPWTWTNW